MPRVKRDTLRDHPAPQTSKASSRHGGKLDGRVVLVTGAGRRVGRAIAEEMGNAGANVIVHYFSSRVEAAQLASKLPKSLVCKADLRTADGCRSLMAAVRQHVGKLDFLVNSAADYTRGPFAYESDETWTKMLALNLLAPARLLREALPLGLSACVNIVDVAAWKPWKHHAAYAASKAALAHLTRCLALELAPSVRVNGVAPGTVAFPPGFSEAEQAGIINRIPLGRIGQPRDVARAVRYLLEEDYLSGVLLPVDGGASLV
jgi:pteridine reductase